MDSLQRVDVCSDIRLAKLRLHCDAALSTVLERLKCSSALQRYVGVGVCIFNVVGRSCGAS